MNQPLAGRRVVLGISGGIAAYKSVALLRELTRAGLDVTVVPTPAALHFVGAATLAALSGHPVHTSVFDADGARHVELGRSADLVIVAPATADLLARAVAGRADDLLTATLLMAHCPVLYAPAMHTEMWRHCATRRNVATLLAEPSNHVIGPAIGALAGGDEGQGRMSEPAEIASAAFDLLAAPSAGEADAARDPSVTGRDLAGQRVLITAGGTREAIDPVRFIGNRSSGRQGIALARRALARGADVRLIAANPTEAIPPQLEPVTTLVTSAADLAGAVRRDEEWAHIIVMAAAVADFRPAADLGVKLKRAGRSSLAIELEPTEDILAGLVARRRPGTLLVGFAAETGDERRSARELGRAKAIAKGADLLVCNEVSTTKGFEVPDNDVIVFDATGTELVRRAGTKDEVADAVWDVVAQLLDSSRLDSSRLD